MFHVVLSELNITKASSQMWSTILCIRRWAMSMSPQKALTRFMQAGKSGASPWLNSAGSCSKWQVSSTPSTSQVNLYRVSVMLFAPLIILTSACGLCAKELRINWSVVLPCCHFFLCVDACEKICLFAGCALRALILICLELRPVTWHWCAQYVSTASSSGCHARTVFV